MARRSIDWLHSTTCRVLALMGGEPLLRRDFAHKVVDCAAQKGFWVYVPTNARLLCPDVTDRLADAGVATFNFAVDVVDEEPGLPKALAPIRRYFEYLVDRTIPIWLHGILQHQYLEDEHGRCPAMSLPVWRKFMSPRCETMNAKWQVPLATKRCGQWWSDRRRDSAPPSSLPDLVTERIEQIPSDT